MGYGALLALMKLLNPKSDFIDQQVSNSEKFVIYNKV